MLPYLKSLLEQARREIDGRSAAICAAAALCLIAARYLGRGSRDGAFGGLGWWIGGLIACYLVLPALFVRLGLREPLSRHGLNLGASRADWRFAGAAFAVMAPVALLASALPGFRTTYPLYDGLELKLILAWEAVYLAHFLALEFFFRGFLIHGLKDKLGWNAILVSLLPYVMIHFGKPLPEAAGSIAAGLVLGAMSLRSGSIVPGLAVHGGVALLMDFCVLKRNGFL